MKKLGARARLTAIAVLVIAVVVLCAGLMLMIVQQRLLTDDLDQTLQVQSTTIEREFLAGTLPRVVEEQGTDDLIAQVVYADSTVLASTANMEGQPALASPDGAVSHWNTTLAIDYRRYRLLSRQVGDVVIHTGTPINQVERATDALRTALAVGIPTATLLLGVLAWLLIGRALGREGHASQHGIHRDPQESD